MKIISHLYLVVLFVVSYSGINLALAADSKNADLDHATFAQAAEEVEGEVVDDGGSEGEVYEEGAETYDDGGEYDDQGYEDQAYEDSESDDEGYDDGGDENSGEVEDPNAVEEPAEPEESVEN